MILYAARYFKDNSEKEYWIVTYPSRAMVEEQPHDYNFMFEKSEWRKMKCRVPKRGETLVVELLAKAVV
jgi:hypothetical protein